MATKVYKIIKHIGISGILLINAACIPTLVNKEANKKAPENFGSLQDSTTNTAQVKWKDFFTDPNLISLIDTALKNNQGLNIMLQDIKIADNQVRSRKGQYLPFVNIFGMGSISKEGRYTRIGALDANVPIDPDKSNAEVIPNLMLGADVSWQVDIWKQLRNSKKSAMYNYLSSIEGKNFMVTNLIAEIAYAYYELLSLDNQLDILKANIEIQQNALRIVTLEKTAGTVTELAVQRFEAEVNKNLSRQYYFQQQIIETQNKINYLVGRYPQVPARNSLNFTKLEPNKMSSGVPPQLLANRPDIRQAELVLEATKLDIKVAKANFYPKLNITSAIGYEAYNAKFFIKSPESMFYSLAGGLVAPLINRNAIKAEYLTANSRQLQAVYDYERTLLRAYTEVVNQLANIDNLANSFESKSKQVDALTQSVNISINLFKSARADYVEVLLTQRDALESKLELIETKQQQMNASVKMYQVLGGGWR